MTHISGEQQAIPWDGGGEGHLLSPGGDSAALAHDVRGLLTVLVGHAQMLAEGQEQAEQRWPRDSCETILWSCKLISDLIENALALQRTAEPAADASAELGPCVRRCTRAYGLVAGRKQTRIECRLGGKGLRVACAAWLVERIVSNLLSNAIKFSPPHSTVQVSARADGPSAVLVIQDQGPGITAEEVPRLFRRFVKGAARPTAGERSTGLGLAIVRELVLACGGSIEVDGRPGRGACFTVRLPRCAR